MKINNTPIIEIWEQEIAKNPMLSAGVSLLRELDDRFPSSQSLIVGGTVRDLLLHKPIKDVILQLILISMISNKRFKLMISENQKILV